MLSFDVHRPTIRQTPPIDYLVNAIFLIFKFEKNKNYIYIYIYKQHFLNITRILSTDKKKLIIFILFTAFWHVVYER